MAFYREEEEVWKCTKHTSKRHRNTGICPYCLKDRLSLLCPDCANLKPCSCFVSASTTSSSDSSTFSINLDRVSNLVHNEPHPHPRTKFPFFRSARFSESVPEQRGILPLLSVWSVFRKGGSKLARSKSVAADGGNAVVKGNRWYFPSPMKIFRHVKASKVAHQRSPLR